MGRRNLCQHFDRKLIIGIRHNDTYPTQLLIEELLPVYLIFALYPITYGLLSVNSLNMFKYCNIERSGKGRFMVDQFIRLMRAPCVYFRIPGITAAFFLLSWFHYQSAAVAFYYSIVCLIMLEMGYIGGVMFLVWREAKQRPVR